MGQSSTTRFSDGEIYFQILENVRGADVFIVQPTGPPVDSNLMELFLMIDAFKRASAKRITAVIPYFGYARQDRKDKPRVPISAKVVSDLLVASGTHRLLTMDLHAPQIQGFFSIPVDHLFAAPVLVEYFQKLNLPNLTIVSPDAGGVERARAFAKRLHAELAMANKRRLEANVAEVVNLIGEVRGRTCLVVDDLIDTAGTLVKTVEALKVQGATKVYATCSHPVLSGPAVDRIEKSALEEVVVTNSIQLQGDLQNCRKIRVLSVGNLLAQAVQSIHEETSVSGLFI
jgi:ribose-phosphate pyrophosphokinase